MILNYYENTLIKNSSLPKEWQSQADLDGLLDFLQSNWEQRDVFYNDEKLNSKQSFLEFVGQKAIKTRDYIGTIIYKGNQLNIFPKMFKCDKDDTNRETLDLKLLMHNLVEWIKYTTKINYPYINISADIENSDNLQKLFISLYVRYVKYALDRGFYFRYEEKNEDLSTIRGKFNLKDYYINKYYNGNFNKMNCTYSNFEFDNLLNRIIKYTLKYISHYTDVKNQKIIRSLLIKLGDVTDQKCTPSDCEKIQLSKMQNKYKIILSMSKMFLLNKSTNYNMDFQDSFCFLFPTDILFEGFIGGYLQSILSDEANVKLQSSETPPFVDSISLGDKEYKASFKIRHDIIVKHKEKGLFILDTKYKEIHRFDNNPNFENDIVRDLAADDLHQITDYAVSVGLNKIYLLFPLYRFEDIEPYPAVLNRSVIFEGKKYSLKIYVVRLPFVFENNETNGEEKLKKVLLSLFKN